MGRNYVFILREDMYDEWAWENGATNLICVSHNMYEVVDVLREYLKMELVEDENRIFGDYYGTREIDNIITNTIELFCKNHQCVSVDVYTNEDNYSNGRNFGTFVIEKMEMK